jgi:hypothetical protein
MRSTPFTKPECGGNAAHPRSCAAASETSTAPVNSQVPGSRAQVAPSRIKCNPKQHPRVNLPHYSVASSRSVLESRATSVIHPVDHGTHLIYCIDLHVSDISGSVHGLPGASADVSKTYSSKPQLADTGRHQALLCSPSACTGKVPYLGLNEGVLLGVSLPRCNSIPQS